MLEGGAILGIPMMEWNESTTDLLFFGNKRGRAGKKSDVLSVRVMQTSTIQ